jgi:hypothetical protein
MRPFYEDVSPHATIGFPDCDRFDRSLFTLQTLTEHHYSLEIGVLRGFNVNFLRFCRVAATLVAFVPSLACAAVPEVKPGQDFVGIGYSLSSSGNVIVYAGIREIGGKVAVCGMVWYEKATSSTRAIEAKFTEKMSFKIGKKGLTVSTRAFNRFKTKEDAQAGQARCSVTTTAWRAEYAKAKLTMKLGSVTIYE